MPKKTRKEKLAAEKHRTQTPVVAASRPTLHSIDARSSSPISNTAAQEPINVFFIQPIRRELVKTIILSTIIIVIELILAQYVN